MWREGRREKRPRSFKSLTACVCVCVHLCFSVYVTRLSVFVSPCVIVCHCLCESLSVSATCVSVRV